MDLKERYNRQLILPEIGEEGQARLQQARVLIVGVGGLGSPIALYLTGSESNLQRQVLYNEKEIGLSKAEKAREHLQALNSHVRIEAYPERLTAENAEAIIGQYDLVLDGCDNFATRYLINDTCIRLGKVYIYGAIRAFDGQVSVFNYQGGPDYRRLFPDEEEMYRMPHPPKGVLGVTPGLIGCAEANEALKIIVGYGEILSGKLWQIDLKTLETFTFLI